MNESEKKPRKKMIWILLIILLAAACVLAWRLWLSPARRHISADNLKKIALLQQGDYTQTLATISGADKSVATSGCGAVCVAMAVSYLNGEPVSPETLFAWACEKGLYFGDGLSHDTLSGMAAQYGCAGEWIGNGNLDKVKAALAAGYPVVAHMGKGTFTRGGHYILLRGMADGERVYVSDPQSIELSARTHALKDIQRELRRENSFMIIRPMTGAERAAHEQEAGKANEGSDL